MLHRNESVEAFDSVGFVIQHKIEMQFLFVAQSASTQSATKGTLHCSTVFPAESLLSSIFPPN
jgi:hypothetical protein